MHRTAHWKTRARSNATVALVLTLLVGAVSSADQDQGSSSCPAEHGKLDQPLHRALHQTPAGGTERQRVIVSVREGFRWVVALALWYHGDDVLADHGSVGAFSARVHTDDLSALVDEWLVTSVSVDGPVRASLDDDSKSKTAPVPTPLLVRETLGLTGSWAGENIGVALLDSGLEPTLDVNKHRIRAFYDFTAGRASVVKPFDDYGHGTHIAGIIGSEGKISNSGDYVGIAPKVSFVVLKVLDRRGVGRTSDVIRALEFVTENRESLGVDVINLSLGHPVYEPAASDPLVQAVENAVRAGISVVVAAGNYGRTLNGTSPGYAGIASPANAPSAITVGAQMLNGTVSRADDGVADYSSRGPTWYDGLAKPDIVAPGHALESVAAKRSKLYQDFPSLRVKAYGWRYMRLNGTSMAAATTTGVVALLLEANRHANGSQADQDDDDDDDDDAERPGGQSSQLSATSLPPNAVKAVLQYTAIPVPGLNASALVQGAGGLNADGAIALARALRTSAPLNTAWLDESLNPASHSSIIGGEVWPWSETVIWGSTMLLGQPLAINYQAWSSAVIWGSSDTVIWGSHDAVVWGSTDSVIWGSHDAVVWGSTDSVIWGSDVVWENMQAWAEAVVWGSDTLGTWSGDSVIWGSTYLATRETLAWGSLADVAGAAMSFSDLQ